MQFSAGIFLRTLQYLSFTQIIWRIRYKFNKAKRPDYPEVRTHPLSFAFSPGAPSKFIGVSPEGTWNFTFLNKTVHFTANDVDWNHAEYGKLWTYNLNYFEFLHQEDLKDEIKRDLLKQFISAEDGLKDALEPYPTSLRAPNWIRYFSRHGDADDPKANQQLYTHLVLLRKSLEYHLLGNHLLENGFALLTGAYYFQNEEWYRKASRLLRKQLKEQLWRDGGHFEQSPMYHCIILYRVLEAVDLVKNNSWQDHELLDFLQERAARMLSFLQNITFSNGDIPMVNDAAPGITYSSAVLQEYATKLGVQPSKLKLRESGYRFWRKGDWEVFVDAGPLAIDYQPGHAHADTFSFILYYKGKPIIVDTGTSTYMKDERRQFERSTLAHNTVVYANRDSSEVWGGFRVGRRASVKQHAEREFYLKAEHNGYKHLGVVHQREFELNSDQFNISDHVSDMKGEISQSLLHFHPSCTLQFMDGQVIVNEELLVYFDGFIDTELHSCEIAMAFNKIDKSSKFIGQFIGHSNICITTTNN